MEVFTSFMYIFNAFSWRRLTIYHFQYISLKKVENISIENTDIFYCFPWKIIIIWSYLSCLQGFQCISYYTYHCHVYPIWNIKRRVFKNSPWSVLIQSKYLNKIFQKDYLYMILGMVPSEIVPNFRLFWYPYQTWSLHSWILSYPNLILTLMGSFLWSISPNGYLSMLY